MKFRVVREAFPNEIWERGELILRLAQDDKVYTLIFNPRRRKVG